ncbi:MAG: metal dependent phosphohydrolase [Fibrobacteres bacterium]|nr:metal dependent phosphohydrolase [Fibrobacterota bacterium]
MPEFQESSPTPKQGDPNVRHGEPRQVAIVGLNRETAALLPSLLDAEGIHVIKVLNPELEDLSRLAQYPHLDIIIDTTHNAPIAARLRKLPLKRVDVISGLGARLLFCSIRKGHPGEKDGILKSLEEIREALCLTKNKAEILKLILSTAVKTSGADCGSLMLLDPSRRTMTIEAALGLDESVVVSSIQPVGKGVSGNAVRRGEPILINGAVDRAAYSADYQKPEIVSSICCPLMHEGEALGVINIASKDPKRIFNSADVEFLEELARLSAEVVKTSSDYEIPQHSTYTLGLLSSAREILAMKYRFEERLNLLLMKMANAFGAKVCTYYEFNAGDRCFLAKASSSVGLNLLRERPMLLDDFFSQRVLKTGNTFCVNATGKEPRSKKWYMLHPIRSGNDLMGTLFIHLASEKNHLKEEMALLRKIGDLVAREMIRNREQESIKVQSLKYSAIAQFSFDILNARTLPELSKMILSNVRLIMEAETCVLRLRNSASEELAVCDSLSHRNPVWVKDILATDGVIASGMVPGKGMLKIDKLSESRYASENMACESLLAAAIEINGEVLATLTLYDRKSADQPSTRSFPDQDKDVLMNFCTQVAKGLKRFFPFPAPVPAAWEPVLADH